jgi:coenzyme Q-binding protein COQ10
MPKVAVKRQVRHAAEQMCDLVADVERYPEFVPLCESLKLKSRTTENGREVLVADMAVGYKAIRETISTRVVVDRAALTIDFTYLDGPFRHMSGGWRFERVGPHESVVQFAIDYEFRSRILSMLMGSVFETVFGRFAEAFEKRADAMFGSASGAFTTG